MFIEQLKLTSVPDGHQCQLVARSGNVDDRLTNEIASYLPGRNSLEYGQRESISYFKLGDNPLSSRFAFVRSTAGPVDTQNQRQIISFVAILDVNQFRKYKFHAPNVIHCLRSSGQFTLDTDASVVLPKLEIPNRFSLQLLGHRTSASTLAQVESALELHDQVGVLGANEPMELVAAVFNQADPETRQSLSFATARRANGGVSFRLYVHRQEDDDMSREFVQQQIRPLKLNSVAVG